MRPNKQSTADKRMEEIVIDLKSKVPVILRKALGRIERMVEDDKTSDSNILRACEQMYKYLRDTQEADKLANSPADKTNPDLEDDEPEKPTSVISMFAQKK